MKEINIIRNEYKDIKFIFDFIDRFCKKMQLISVEEKSSDTVRFEDYYNDVPEILNVPIGKVNNILDHCYCEYFFKIVLSGSLFYQKVKKICDDLDIDISVFDLFFRSLFLAIKQFYNSNYSNSNLKNNRDAFYKVVLNAHSDAFDSFPKINIEKYKEKFKLILEKLEDVGLLCFKDNDVTGDSRLKEYFPISCDTFKFHITSGKDKDKFDRGLSMFDFLDLRLFLNNTNSNLLERMDRAVHVIILISFKDIEFHNNPYSDNSYIKKLFIDREQLRLKKQKQNA